MTHTFLDREVRVQADGATLAGTLSIPQLDQQVPALLLISGSGANDRDETVLGQKPFCVIAQHFAEQGYAVLRYDDRGVAGSSGDAHQQDFTGSVNDARAAAQWLMQQPEIDPRSLVVLGHSEGGLIAAELGGSLPIAAVVMLAGPAEPIETLLHRQARIISVESGATPEQQLHEQRMNEAVFAIAREENALVQQDLERVICAYLLAWPGLFTDEAGAAENARAMAQVIAAPAYRTFLRQQPARIFAAVDCPLLAIFGGKDTQVAGYENAEAARTTHTRRGPIDIRLFDQHNHLFQIAQTGSILEYEVLPPGPTIDVLQAIEQWLDGVLEPRSESNRSAKSTPGDAKTNNSCDS